MCKCGEACVDPHTSFWDKRSHHHGRMLYTLEQRRKVTPGRLNRQGSLDYKHRCSGRRDRTHPSVASVAGADRAWTTTRGAGLGTQVQASSEARQASLQTGLAGLLATLGLVRQRPTRKPAQEADHEVWSRRESRPLYPAQRAARRATW